MIKNIIESINIIAHKSTYGTAVPIIKKDKELNFIIELSDEVLIEISNSKNLEKYLKAKSVFQHEIYHCIEMKILYESNIEGISDIWGDTLPVNNTYNFIYSEAVNIWSEFYAVHYNHKINSWHEIPNTEMDIEQLYKWIYAAKYQLANTKTVHLCKAMFLCLHEFGYHMVSMIAIHINNHEDSLIQNYTNSKHFIIQKYFSEVYDFLESNLKTYPSWLSKDNYIRFGKLLMKILELNKITYTTDDLSDNFIFKYNP